MKITLQDTVFCVTGKYETFRVLHDLEAALMEGGGHVTATVQPHTQVLFINKYSSSKEGQARMQGIPILDEAQALTLLEQGWIEVEFARPSLLEGEDTMGALIAQARGVLAGGQQDASMVEELVELIERCEPEAMPIFVNYLQDHISTWTPSNQLLWELPESWMTSVLDEEDSVAYQLIRRINLLDLKLKMAEYKVLFACSNFTQVQRIDFPQFKHITKAVLKLCSNQEALSAVDTLNIGRFKPNAFDGWTPQGSLRNVRKLCLDDLDSSDLTHETAQSIWGSPCMERIEHLELEQCFQLYGLEGLGTSACLPSLTSLTLHHAYPHSQVRHWMTHSVGPVIQHLTLWGTNCYGRPPKPRFKLDEMEAMKTLELRLSSYPMEEQRKIWDMSALFLLDFDHLPPNLETIRTNIPLNQKGIPELMENLEHIEWSYDDAVMPL